MAAASTSSSLMEYLKKYEIGGQEQQKKRKKKAAKPDGAAGGVLIFDEDSVWARPVILEVEEDDSAGEDMPVGDDDVEVKCLRRLELLRSRKPYHAISKDGSGWVSISDASRHPGYSEEVPDLSPPRQRRTRLDTSSPGREEARHGDLSPPRKGRKGFPENLSPPMRGRDGLPQDLSPPRERNSLADDLSPPRRARHHMVEANRQCESAEGDLSLPRSSKRGSVEGFSQPRRGQNLPDADQSPLRESRKRHLSATENRHAGLFTGREIKEENQKKKKEEISRLAAMDPGLSGKGTEPVFRHKATGKRLSKELLKMQVGEEKPKEKNLEWGKGLVQKREAETRALELELGKEQPFARSRDDPELDKMLRERPRWGDPMAHLVKKKHSEPAFEDFGVDEKMKESGFIIPQTTPFHSWIKRGIDPPPNRYGIRPGRHWDGVDRSTGYEKEMFKRQNEGRATETEAYLWSVSDM